MRRLPLLAALALGTALPAAAQTGCPPQLLLERIEFRSLPADRFGEPVRGYFAIFVNNRNTSIGVTVTRGPVQGLSPWTPGGRVIIAPGQSQPVALGTSTGAALVPESAILAALTYGCRV